METDAHFLEGIVTSFSWPLTPSVAPSDQYRLGFALAHTSLHIQNPTVLEVRGDCPILALISFFESILSTFYGLPADPSISISDPNSFSLWTGGVPVFVTWMCYAPQSVDFTLALTGGPLPSDVSLANFTSLECSPEGVEHSWNSTLPPSFPTGNGFQVRMRFPRATSEMIRQTFCFHFFFSFVCPYKYRFVCLCCIMMWWSPMPRLNHFGLPSTVL